MLHIIHGNGKGKTTAAFGMALRQLGHEKKVLIIQFLKDGNSGEVKALQSFHNVSVHATNISQKFFYQMSEDEKKLCKKEQLELFEIATIKSCRYDCIILDEVLDILDMEILEEDMFMEYVRKHQHHHEIILTGRNPSIKLQECSDYNNEVIMKKHPYEKGVAMRIGVEY